MGETQKVKSTRFRTLFLPSAGLVKWYEFALVGMDGQSVTLKSFAQDRHYPAGITLQFTADYKIIRKSGHKATPSHPGLHFFLKPLIQHIVQIHIR